MRTRREDQGYELSPSNATYPPPQQVGGPVPTPTLQRISGLREHARALKENVLELRDKLKCVLIPASEENATNTDYADKEAAAISACRADKGTELENALYALGEDLLKLDKTIESLKYDISL